MRVGDLAGGTPDGLVPSGAPAVSGPAAAARAPSSWFDARGAAGATIRADALSDARGLSVAQHAARVLDALLAGDAGAGR